MITPKVGNTKSPRAAKCYLHKMDEGIIVVVNDQGQMVGDTVNVVVDNGTGQYTTATVTLIPDGWYEDIQNAD